MGDHVVERHAAEPFSGVAEGRPEGLVGLHDAPALHVRQEDVLGRLLHDSAVQALALLQGLFDLLAPGYVARYREETGDVAPGVAKRDDVGLEPAEALRFLATGLALP